MVKIKICGMTRVADALAAVRCGADAIGLVFYPKSPRYIDPDQAARLVAALPPFVAVAGLFVNQPPEWIHEITRQCRLTDIQLHGDEPPAACLGLPARVIKAIRVATPADLQNIDQYPVAGILLDAKVSHAYGGTGQAFDWTMLDGFQCRTPLILAGGLNPDNVQQAIRMVKPYGVDLSSGVEVAPGIKDHDKMCRFMDRVRQTVLSPPTPHAKPSPG
ncbi:MAG: phosphoribosylanthranilate isomerase [Magnetococcus sp. DMHC-1]|nr:phosphoribosylanthranilate isomerase [Magnetococcales bacterium]